MADEKKEKPKRKVKKVAVEVPIEPEKPEPELIPEYSGPMVVLFENPTQVKWIRNLLNQPQALSGDEVLAKARIIECMFQSVPFTEFSDKILSSYMYKLKVEQDRKDEEAARQEAQKQYDAQKDPGAKAVVANTPKTLLEPRK